MRNKYVKLWQRAATLGTKISTGVCFTNNTTMRIMANNLCTTMWALLFY